MKTEIRPGKCMTMLIFYFLIFSIPLFSQAPAGDNSQADIKNYREELFLRTDRDIYITGEHLWFKVYDLNGLTMKPSDLSKVIYVELLDKNNFPLKQIKVKNDDKSGFSGFTLPENMNSGSYIIRAYTSWMKNFSTDFFYYKSISVINPFESIDHLKIPAPGINNSDSASTHYAALSQSVILDATEKPVYSAIPQPENKNKVKFTVTAGKAVYSPREQVSMEITATDMAGNPVETDLSLSIAKAAVVSGGGNTSFNNFSNKDGALIRTGKTDQLAEIEGHLVSGYLRLKANDEPLKKTDVSLSFVGKTSRCQFTTTDDKGEFFFLIREPGQKEIVIQPISSEVTGYYIELNQPFSSLFSKYKPSEFYLDSSRLDAINKVIVGMQVNNIYDQFRQIKPAENQQSLPDFYGKPESTIKTADYIELTSLREVVKEIIPNVYTLKQNGKYDFKLINKFKGQPFENKPLILVDGVPVYDFEKVLAIGSKEIERVDVINTRYFVADNVFDGIVSFVTKKGNLSVMDFDNNIFRQVYEGCKVPESFYFPDFSTKEAQSSHIPDFRNTLFWKPDLHTDKNGKAEVTFYTSDESADFRITLEGIAADGSYGYSVSPFVVK